MAQKQPVTYGAPNPPPANVDGRPNGPRRLLPEQREQHATQMLLSYIVDYFEKRKYRDTIEALKRESQIQTFSKPPVNSPDGLLWEWWTCFWETYVARVHPSKTCSPLAKEFAESRLRSRTLILKDQGLPLNLRHANTLGPYVNGGPGHPVPPSVNGYGPPVPYPTPPSGAQPGPTPNTVNSNANPTALQNPNLQYLQQPPRPSNGMPYPPRNGPPNPPNTQFPIQPGGSMPGRAMPNGVPTNANSEQTPGQQTNSPQNQEVASSPRNLNPSEAPNPAPGDDSKENIQRTPRVRATTRGQKRHSEGESPSKGETPPDRKKPRRSPQENGAALPSTPSIPSTQPVGMGPPPPPSGPFPTLSNKAGAQTPFSHPLPNNGAPPPAGPASRTPGSSSISQSNPPAFPPAMAGQLRELQNTHTNVHQQYFQQISDTAMTAYAVKPGSISGAAGPSGPTSSSGPELNTAARPPVGVTNAPKGSMLPPPPPNASQQPPLSGTNMNTTPKTPMTNNLVPPNAAVTKDGSPKVDSASSENARPASRPTLSTPQGTTSTPTPTPTGVASTPGGPTIKSAPSPAPLATPQQTSRPPSQSPNARPSTSGGTVASSSSSAPPPNPSAILARGYASSNHTSSATNGTPTSVPSSITPASVTNGPVTSGMSSLTGTMAMSGGNDLGTDEILNGVGLNSMHDYQMMNFQHDSFDPGMSFDFAFDTSFGSMGDFGGYLNDGLDSSMGT